MDLVSIVEAVLGRVVCWPSLPPQRSLPFSLRGAKEEEKAGRLRDENNHHTFDTGSIKTITERGGGSVERIQL